MRTFPLAALAAALAGCPSSAPPAPAAAAASARPVASASAPAIVSAPAPVPAAPLDPATLPGRVPCPEDMVPTGVGGCIDAYEASMGTGSVGDVQAKGTTLVPASKAGKTPISGLSQKQAVRACENAKKHLCDEKEWLAACRGPAKWEYTYGNEYVPNRCRDWHDSAHGTAGAAPTGSYPGCVNSYGAFDLTNNVGELTATAERSGNFAVRGGTYNMVIHDSACDEDDYTIKGDAQNKDVGFRCCAPAIAADAGAPKKP